MPHEEGKEVRERSKEEEVEGVRNGREGPLL